jgi:Ca2+-binding RTX toxin-like protein
VAINGQQFGPFAAASIQGIHASGNSGDDVIHINAGNVPATIDGGLGNDQLFGGGGNNRLLGGPGNDQLTGGAGPNILFGGLGNDDLRPGVSPSNDVYGGDPPNDPAGTDTVDYSQHTHGVVIRIDGLRDSGASGEHDLIDPTITYVYGSQGNDIIFGGNGELKEALYGLGGSDTIYAGNGGSALYGGDGNDFLYARNSIADYLDGGAGTDSGHIDTLLDKTVSVEVFLP